MLEYYQVCSNDDPGLTLTYFMAGSNLVTYAFVWEKGKTMDFSETIVVYDIIVGRCSKVNEYMNLYEYQRSRSFIDLGPRSLRFNSFKLLFLSNRYWSQLKPNFMWSLHGIGEQKFVQMVQVTWPVWPHCPYMVKTLKVVCWADWGFFHDHNFILKYHIHNSSALRFDMQSYWKFHQLIFEGKNGLKVKFWIKAT